MLPFSESYWALQAENGRGPPRAWENIYPSIPNTISPTPCHVVWVVLSWRGLKLGESFLVSNINFGQKCTPFRLAHGQQARTAERGPASLRRYYHHLLVQKRRQDSIASKLQSQYLETGLSDSFHCSMLLLYLEIFKGPCDG